MEVSYIVEQFGEPNEPVDEDLLENIIEEISSLDEEHYFDLAEEAIELGKPQILAYLVENGNFTKSEMKEFKNLVEKFVKESEDDDDIDDIVIMFETIIKNRENPRKKRWN